MMPMNSSKNKLNSEIIYNFHCFINAHLIYREEASLHALHACMRPFFFGGHNLRFKYMFDDIMHLRTITQLGVLFG